MRFCVGDRGPGREPGLRDEKAVDAVSAVAARVPLKVLQDGTDPDGAGAEFLDVPRLCLDATESPALECVVIRVLAVLTLRRSVGIAEPVGHREADASIEPVAGLGERARTVGARRSMILPSGVRLRRSARETPQPSPDLAQIYSGSGPTAAVPFSDVTVYVSLCGWPISATNIRWTVVMPSVLMETELWSVGRSTSGTRRLNEV